MNSVLKPRKRSVHNVQYIGSDGSNVHDSFDLKGESLFANPPWIVKVREDNPKLYLLNIGPKKSNEHIFLGNQVVVSVPTHFDDIIQEIEKSKYILTLEDDWDDEGSSRYEKSIWIKAVQFVVLFASLTWDSTRKLVATPKIYHGPNGSIDVSWEEDRFNLLLNIFQKDEKYFATFYGDAKDANQEMKGFFALEDFSLNLFPLLVHL